MLPSIMSLLACEGPILYYTANETTSAVPRLPLQPIPVKASVSDWANKTEILHPQTYESVERDIVEDDPQKEDRIKVSGRHIPIIKFPYKDSARPAKNPKFEPRVLKILKDSYAHDPRPSNEEKQKLADMTNKTWVQIHNWFSNRRRRYGQNIPGEQDQGHVSSRKIVWTLPNE